MNAEPASGFGSVAGSFLECSDNHVGLEPSNSRRKLAKRPIRSCGMPRIWPDREEFEFGCGDRLATTKNRDALDRILEFPDVAGPRVAMSRLMLKSAKRASLIENLRGLRGLGKMRVR